MIAAVLLLLLVGCSLLAPPDSFVRIINLTEQTVTAASVTPCDGGTAAAVPAPIGPGASSDSPALEPGCYDVYAAGRGGTHEARVTVEVGAGSRLDVRIRPVGWP